jgi:hypothetical protein
MHLDPLDDSGIALGAFLDLSARGSVNGVVAQPLGNLRITKAAGGF